MQLAKLIIEARYSEPPRETSLGLALAEALQVPELLAQVRARVGAGPTIRHELKIAADRVVVGVDETRAGVDVDWPPDDERAAALAVAYLDKIRKAVTVDRLSRLGIRSIWIEPRESSFEDLVQLLKLRWLAKGELITTAEDLAVSLVLERRANRVNLSLGPIKADEFPRWGLEPRPNLESRPMLLVDIDHAERGTDVRYERVIRFEAVRDVLIYARTLAELVAVVTAPQEAIRGS